MLSEKEIKQHLNDWRKKLPARIPSTMKSTFENEGEIKTILHKRVKIIQHLQHN